MLVIHLAMNGSNLSAWLKDVGSEDFISLVPNHWLEQAAPSSTLTSFIGVIFLIFCLINNVCTILLILSLARNPKLRTNSNKLLMSLTMADFVLLSGGHLIVIQSFAGFPILGKLGCRICGFVGTVGALAEIWSLTAIAVDRLKAIYHPLQKKKRLNKKEVGVIILVIWIGAIAFALCPLLGWNQFVSEALVIGCSFDSFSTEWSDRSYILVLVLVAWCLPMGVLCQCYFRIFYAVRGGIFNWTELPDAAEDQRRRIERTLAKMVSCLLLLWFVSWTPYAILSLWTMFFQARGLTPTLALLPTILCKVSATLNGFTYGVR
ncbi:rhodopsin, GQ-coupled-like [Tigriopus californicus]|uniref:rhodopsin, GQ-coupled-like n=1 Tax=Tigriopus californicus TaxID=6832 RepID=UPI0027DA7DBF|nr:rhodopsin, GQ-coupled-like [Tigriopus californicus]